MMSESLIIFIFIFNSFRYKGIGKHTPRHTSDHVKTNPLAKLHFTNLNVNKKLTNMWG